MGGGNPPIKPQNFITFGGVRVNLNEVASKSTDLNGNFIINFKNGTTIRYKDQTQIGNIFPNANPASVSASGTSAINLNGAVITLGGNKGSYFSVDGGVNNTVNGTPGNDFIDANNSRHITINGGAGNDYISVIHNTSTYFSEDGDSVNINPGKGGDDIYIDAYDDIRAYGQNVHNIPLPQGKVKMDANDRLTVTRSTLYSENGAYEEIVNATKIEGEGVHDISQTPFGITRRRRPLSKY